MYTIQHNPARLYNCNEMGITTVQHKHTKILGLKGKGQISSVQSAERGSLVTVVTCLSPTGHIIPPLLVFPRKIMKEELMNGTPPGSIHACHSSGWIQSEIFTQQFLQFIRHTKPTKEDPVILVSDGHYSHTKNVEFIDLARENHVAIICLPPHNSHKMQPLDKAFMGPLKTFYRGEISKQLCSNLGRVATIYQNGEQFSGTYKRTATSETASNGFRATGLFPCYKNIFRPHDFPLASEDTDTATVNHLALVKTSDQPSFGSVNISPFTSAGILRASGVSRVQSLNLQPNTHSETAEKITNLPYKSLLGQLIRR